MVLWKVSYCIKKKLQRAEMMKLIKYPANLGKGQQE